MWDLFFLLKVSVVSEPYYWLYSQSAPVSCRGISTPTGPSLECHMGLASVIFALVVSLEGCRKASDKSIIKYLKLSHS